MHALASFLSIDARFITEFQRLKMLFLLVFEFIDAWQSLSRITGKKCQVFNESVWIKKCSSVDMGFLSLVSTRILSTSKKLSISIWCLFKIHPQSYVPNHMFGQTKSLKSIECIQFSYRCKCKWKGWGSGSIVITPGMSNKSRVSHSICSTIQN